MGNELIEGNKLIAEFMEYKLVPFHSPFLGMGWRKENLNNSPLYKFLEGNEEKQLYFHSDWNWLMPVVLKIYESKEFKHLDTMGRIAFENSIGSGIIEYAFSRVVEFIQWYNQNKY